MASPTKVHKVRKILRNLAKGKKRKNEVRRIGTTGPSLPLNKPNANELKQTKRA